MIFNKILKNQNKNRKNKYNKKKKICKNIIFIKKNSNPVISDNYFGK